MPDQSAFLDTTLGRLAVGLAGAVVSLRFVRGTRLEILLMVLGGLAISYLGTPTLARVLDMTGSDEAGILGFFLGLLGMSLVKKVYEILEAVDAIGLSQSVVDRIRKYLGG